MQISEGAGTTAVSESKTTAGAFCFGKAASLEFFNLAPHCFCFPAIFGFLITPAFPLGWLLSWGLADTWAFGTEGTVDSSEPGPLETPFIFWKGFLERCCFAECCFASVAPLAFLEG